MSLRKTTLLILILIVLFFIFIKIFPRSESSYNSRHIPPTKAQKETSIKKVLPSYTIRGIDISHHNGVTDYTKLKKENLDFIIVKATEGIGFTDKKYSQNIKDGRANNYKMGAYNFYRLCENGVEQAEHYISIVKKEDIDIAPVMDLELFANCRGKSVEVEVENIKKYLDKIESHYKVKPIIYTTVDTFAIYKDKLNITGYPMWVRITDRHVDGDDYTPIFGLEGDKEKEIRNIFKGNWILWQYCDTCKVSGITGNVDMNYFKGSREEWEKFLIKH